MQIVQYGKCWESCMIEKNCYYLVICKIGLKVNLPFTSVGRWRGLSKNYNFYQFIASFDH